MKVIAIGMILYFLTSQTNLFLECFKYLLKIQEEIFSHTYKGFKDIVVEFIGDRL